MSNGSKGEHEARYVGNEAQERNRVDMELSQERGQLDRVLCRNFRA